MKLEQGDSFERTYADWLRQRLPHYEPVWAAFIGHNGRGWPLSIPGIDEPTENARKHFYQAHYSFACKMHAIEAYETRVDDTLGDGANFAAFEAEMNHLFCLMASVGYVRDMFKRINDSLDAGGSLYDSLQTFYAQRSHVMHGPRVPIRLSDGLIMIPKVGGENKLAREWDDRSTWDSIPSREFVFLRDYAGEVIQSLFHEVNAVHGKVFDAADRRFGGRRIDEQSIFATPTTPLSGGSDWIYSPPPSGNMLG